MSDEKAISLIKKTTGELLKKLNIKGDVDFLENKDDVVSLKIDTEEGGVLIGYHGETLAAFQLIVSLIAYKKQGSWNRVVIEVGDYRERRQEQLTQMAISFAQKVKATNQTVAMPYLSPSERRYVHLALQDDPDVVSESEGEGPSRRLIIKPRVK